MTGTTTQARDSFKDRVGRFIKRRVVSASVLAAAISGPGERAGQLLRCQRDHFFTRRFDVPAVTVGAGLNQLPGGAAGNFVRCGTAIA